MTAEGYPLCFINELTPLNGDRRMVGRARTARYLPNRKDLREKVYAAGPQLNYRTAEEAQAGDVLVVDAGGETRSTISGAMVTTRFLMKGGADGGGRLHAGCAGFGGDAGEFLSAVRTRFEREPADDERGLPGAGADWRSDCGAGTSLVGDRHGVLVIPAAIVDKVVDKALEHDAQERFQRKLLLEGEPIYGVYPNLNEANKKKFEEWKKK